MAKVLLLNPLIGEGRRLYIPYALLFLKSSLEAKGHDVTIIDFQTGERAYELYRASLSQRPDILGVSLFCGPSVELARNAAEACRKVSPQTTIVWGGVLPSLTPEMILRDTKADYVVLYEGEEAFPKLIEALERGDRHPEIENVAWMNGEDRVIRPRAPLLDLKSFSPIDFTGIDDEKYVIRTMPVGRRVVSIFTSRGCPYSCTFCYNRSYNRGRWRPFPTPWILDTIDKLVKTYGIDGLIVLDDDFFVNRDRVMEIMEGVKKQGHDLKWWTEIRADQVLSLGSQGLEEFYRLGLRVVYVGAESGSNRILGILNKGITVEDVLEANKIISETELLTLYSFMVEVPTETIDETHKTVDLAVELLDSNPRASVAQINNYTPWPGTLLYETAVENDFKPFKQLDDWSNDFVLKPGAMPWSTLSYSRLQCISCASLFQKSDEILKNIPLLIRFILKMYRAVSGFRLRKHIFFPFLDVWLFIACVERAAALSREKIKRFIGSISAE